MLKIKILSISLLLSAISLSAQTYSGGSGAQSDPFLISSKADMIDLSIAVEEGTTYEGKYFRLTQNLTGSDAVGTSVGAYFDTDYQNCFSGVFDGGGFEIELNDASEGVFGNLQYATVQNLGVSGTVSASTASNNDLYAGGICGYSNYSTIAYCYNAASVSAVSANAETTLIRVGGICGRANNTTISDCFNRGGISGSSYHSPCYIGGIIGYLFNGSILNCYNTGNVSAINQNLHWTTAGGICGYAYSYETNKSSIKNCFSANSSIEAKFNNASIDTYAGRIAGSIFDIFELYNNYALSTMEVNGSTINSSNESDPNGAGTSLENFQSQSWIQNQLGWDFDAVWQMSQGSSVNQGFPVFRNTDKPVNYTITAKAGNNGSISPSGDTTILQGENLTYTFTPQPDFQIYQVFIDDGINYDAVASGSYTFTDLTRNHTIEVVFRLISLPVFSGGAGTKSQPYLISSPEDMVALSNAVEGGTTYEGTFFLLTQDLTGSDAIGTSVGPFSRNSFRNRFSGVFDGGGFEIELEDVEGGVFGNLYYATVQNLGVTGRVTTPVSNTDAFYAGGISAVAWLSKIYNCRNSASVSTKDITVKETNYIGGICGRAEYSEIMYCYNTGNISSTVALSNACLQGGIVGYSNNTQISDCFNFGQVSGSGNNFDSYSGGISGYATMGAITNCYNAGDISAVITHPTDYWAYAGGICGYSANDSSIKDCFSANSSIEAKRYDGSLDSYAGRIAGDYHSNSELSNNYALSNMTVNGATVSSSDATDNNGIGTSLENFHSQTWIQSNLGWDFDTVWQMSDNASAFCGLPIFKYQQGGQNQALAMTFPASAIRVYPNPTEGKVIIESSTLEQGDRIEVYSSTGALLKQFSANFRKTEINLEDLPKGMYVIKVNGKHPASTIVIRHR